MPVLGQLCTNKLKPIVFVFWKLIMVLLLVIYLFYSISHTFKIITRFKEKVGYYTTLWTWLLYHNDLNKYVPYTKSKKKKKKKKEKTGFSSKWIQPLVYFSRQLYIFGF